MSVVLNEVRAVQIPLHSGQLLLPNTSVAEVAGYREPRQLPDSPDWLLGMVDWRQQELPLVCFDGLLGMPLKKMGVRARLAICNTLGENSLFPHIAVLAQSIPRLVRVSEEMVEVDPEPLELSEPVLQQVLINGEKAWIPDLDVLESLVEEAVLQVET